MKNAMNYEILKPLSLVFVCFAALVIGSESSEDKERKPELIDSIVSTSLSECKTIGSDIEREYIPDLTKVLKNVRATGLDVLLDNNIKVCLDQDLNNVDYGFLSRRIKSIYYSEDNSLSISYNGKKAISYSSKLLSKFARKYDSNPDRMLNSQFTQGYTYSSSCGKNCTNTKANYKALDADSDFLTENPILKTAPLKAIR